MKKLINIGLFIFLMMTIFSYGGSVSVLTQRENPNYFFLTFEIGGGLKSGENCTVLLEKIDSKNGRHFVAAKIHKFERKSSEAEKEVFEVSVTLEIDFENLKKKGNAADFRKNDLKISYLGEYELSFGTQVKKKFVKLAGGTARFEVVNHQSGVAEGVVFRISNSE